MGRVRPTGSACARGRSATPPGRGRPRRLVGSAATASPASTTPAGSATTTVQPAVRGFDAADDVDRVAGLDERRAGRRRRRWRTTGPIAVPSSSVNPPVSRSPTRPPTRTVRPASVGEVDAGRRPGAGPIAPSRTRLPTGEPIPDPLGPVPPRPVAVPAPLPGEPPGVDAQVRAAPRQDREPAVRGRRVRPADDAGDGRERPSTTDATGMPGPGLADDHDPVAADDELRAPAVAELVDGVDAAADRHEPPLVRLARARRTAISGAGTAAEPRRSMRVGLDPRRAVGPPDLALDAERRADRRGAFVSGRRTSIAPVASWTTMSRPRPVEQGRRRRHDPDDRDLAVDQAASLGDRRWSARVAVGFGLGEWEPEGFGLALAPGVALAPVPGRRS